MILGQLYYYDGMLHDLEANPSFALLVSTPLLSIDTYPPLEGDIQSYIQDIRSLFAKHYQEFLDFQGNPEAAQIWREITSPTFIPDLSDSSYSGYLSQVHDWLEEGGKIDSLEELISEGSITANQDEFAIYYGLRVIHVLNKVLHSFNTSEYSESEEFAEHGSAKSTVQNQSDLSNAPEFLAVTDTITSPLFYHLNGLVIPPSNDYNELYVRIVNTLAVSPEVKIVLIDTTFDLNIDKIRERIAQTPQYHGIVVSEFTFDLKSESFFDAITKNTLGIRLT